MKKHPSLWLLVILIILTIVRFIVASSLYLSPDEAYYWVWSRALDYSYYDHPPMIALWIKTGCLLWGNTELGVRFLGSVAAFVGSFFVYFAVKDFNRYHSDSRQKAIIAVLLLNATLTVGVGGIIVTPDTPLLFFICIMLWACGRLLYTKSVQYWWVIGASAGLALLSKYTALLMIAALGLWCLFTKEGRGYLKTKELWGGAILAGFIFSPVIIWNSQHQWISFFKQGGRAGDWNPNRALQFLSELLGGQIGLSTPVIFICFCIGLFYLTRAVWQRKCDSGSYLLWLMVVLPVFVFIQHAIGDRVQANWVGLLYPVLVVITGLYVTRWLKTAIVVGFSIVSLVYIQAIFAIVPLPAKKDMLLKQLGGWQSFAQSVNAAVPVDCVIISDNYGLASELRFYLPDRQIMVIGNRWQYFSLPSSNLTEGYFIRRQHAKELSFLTVGKNDYFVSPLNPLGYAPRGSVARIQKGSIAQAYELYLVNLSPDLIIKRESKFLPY
ncbi:ArnT family glycosyltransferase [Commensalibacter papalotli (ex Servin-Garciduenas et al. 2014)]|uniref:Glycosyl/arabinosyl/mannosyl transferase n=1 Tax=Commensalibacter papalotli (ex Servin-Garciduenas et al. 2014) TaxID=1208583 RepID=W7DTA1_9PROT|nr:glycosyltransferase family 39 protein [Commensalibacter papalotli (ex Servin-Garciduenas et al. 2014)]EUK18125.1 glycosyl/arabinosyl/mannosyl transferase [Commensalibacter papalotli (ex Servin-Garciduenas et al. 2014)]